MASKESKREAKYPSVIGICGRKQHGKDTLAEHLIKNYGYEKMSFAGALKEACRVLFNFSDEQLHGDKKEDVDEFWGVSPRVVLQFVGTELFRKGMGKIIPKLGEAFWVKCLQRQLELKVKAGKRIVLTDVRFPDELKLATHVLHVFRPGVADTAGIQAHESERYADEFAAQAHGRFRNEGTVGDLHKKLDALMAQFAAA